MKNTSLSPTLDLCVFLVTEDILPTLESYQLIKSLGATGKYKNIVFLPESGSLYLGTSLEKIKTQDPFYKTDYYALGAHVANKLQGVQMATLIVSDKSLPSPLSRGEKFDFQLGYLQAGWKFDKYLAKKSENKSFVIEWSTDGEILDKKDMAKLKVYDDGLQLTRSWVEETPEYLNPSTIESIIYENFTSSKSLKIEFFDETALAQMGMRCVIAVGRASRHRAKMVKMTLSPTSPKTKTIVLVGKGLTYDSGGLDIKTGGNMKTMKMDMGGSATMAGTMKILSQLELKNTEIVWLSAFVENMVGGDAYKTDDILTSYSGQTIEVWNTDAEGRLTLADVLSYATSLDPDAIIEASTLTGACIGANSEYYTALMCNDKSLATSLMNSFVENFEPTVENPLPEMLRSAVKGTVSDLVNTSTLKQAGHITAGLFLTHFVDQNLFRAPHPEIKNPKCYPYVHLDIAGSVYNDGRNQLGTKGATGQSVRGIVNYILTLDNQGELS